MHDYATSVNLMAFRTSGQERYSNAIANAATYLKKLQWDESKGKKPEDAIHGGAGYGGGSRPDLNEASSRKERLQAENE